MTDGVYLLPLTEESDLISASVAKRADNGAQVLLLSNTIFTRKEGGPLLRTLFFPATHRKSWDLLAGMSPRSLLPTVSDVEFGNMVAMSLRYRPGVKVVLQNLQQMAVLDTYAVKGVWQLKVFDYFSSIFGAEAPPEVKEVREASLKNPQGFGKITEPLLERFVSHCTAWPIDKHMGRCIRCGGGLSATSLWCCFLCQGPMCDGCTNELRPLLVPKHLETGLQPSTVSDGLEAGIFESGICPPCWVLHRAAESLFPDIVADVFLVDKVETTTENSTGEQPLDRFLMKSTPRLEHQCVRCGLHRNALEVRATDYAQSYTTNKRFKACQVSLTAAKTGKGACFSGAVLCPQCATQEKLTNAVLVCVICRGICGVHNHWRLFGQFDHVEGQGIQEIPGAGFHRTDPKVNPARSNRIVVRQGKRTARLVQYKKEDWDKVADIVTQSVSGHLARVQPTTCDAWNHMVATVQSAVKGARKCQLVDVYRALSTHIEEARPFSTGEIKDMYESIVHLTRVAMSSYLAGFGESNTFAISLRPKCWAKVSR